MQNLYRDLEKILLSKDDFKSEDGKILKNKVTELAVANDKTLIGLLLKNTKLKKHFFDEIEKGVISFNKDKFIRFVSNKEFLPNSFTAFTNKIGLHDGTQYLNANEKVSLVWAYKDCVLEGGQDKEDQKRSEIFYNETLAPDEIDRLFEKKVLTNFKKYTTKGSETPKEISDADNLIIKGNNLLALHSLAEKYASKIKLIYIDPPYNTGSDGFQYNDRFTHSTWLTFMKNRLEIAKKLLREDGSIFVQCDDHEQAYLRVLMDEVFGRDNFLNTISLKTKVSSGASGGGEDRRIKKNIEYIHIYVKPSFAKFKDAYFEQPLMKYIEEMKDSGKSFKYTQVLVDTGEKKKFETIKDGSGNDIKIYKHTGVVQKSVNQLAKEQNKSVEEIYNDYYEKIFTTTNAQSSIRQRVWDATGNENDFFSIEYVPKSGKNKGKSVTLYYTGKKKVLVIWLTDTSIKKKKTIYKRLKYGTFWDAVNYNNLNKEGATTFPFGKKPEELLERIISMATDEGDLVMDYHLGSGTTAAVAHKMRRRYIGIEQLNYEENDSLTRLRNVISGDESGVSKKVKWSGGGSFVYAELMENNQSFVDQIETADTNKKLIAIYKKIQEEAFFRYEVDLSSFDIKEFEKLELEDQKQVLLECLDKNHLYVNYGDIDDATYKVSPADKKLNQLFYSK